MDAGAVPASSTKNASRKRCFFVCYNSFVVNQTQTNFQQPKKRLVSKTFIIVFSVIILLPVGLVGGFGIQCKVRQNMHKSNMSDVINEFNELKLTAASSDITKNTQTGGDCVDSSPWVNATQTYTSSQTGEKLIADFRNSMKVQGYKVTNEQYSYSSCGMGYIANAGNGPINISFSAGNFKNTADCYNSYSKNMPAGLSTSVLNNVYARLLNQ